MGVPQKGRGVVARLDHQETQVSLKVPCLRPCPPQTSCGNRNLLLQPLAPNAPPQNSRLLGRLRRCCFLRSGFLCDCCSCFAAEERLGRHGRMPGHTLLQPRGAAQSLPLLQLLHCDSVSVGVERAAGDERLQLATDGWRLCNCCELRVPLKHSCQAACNWKTLSTLHTICLDVPWAPPVTQPSRLTLTLTRRHPLVSGHCWPAAAAGAGAAAASPGRLRPAVSSGGRAPAGAACSLLPRPLGCCRGRWW